MDTLRRLFLYTWRYRKLASLAYGALVGSALLSLVIPRLVGDVVDEALKKDTYIFAGSVIEAVDRSPVLEQVQPLSSSPV